MADDKNIEYGSFERESLPNRIATKLLSMIREKQLKPGYRLPPERELSTLMGVSRPSLREALRALSIMGIIENRQGSGTYVKALEPARVVENLEFILSLDDSTFIELFEARKIIEVGLANMAAQNISESELSILEGIVEEMEGCINDETRFLNADLELHHLIASTAKNQILSILIQAVEKLNIYSRRRTVAMPEVRKQTLRDHREIIKALKARDPDAAGNAMRHHLDSVEQELKHLVNLDSKERPLYE